MNQTSRFLTTKTLHDLGERKAEWSGIFSPEYEDAIVRKFLQEQFLSDAGTYANLYQNIPYWESLLQNALDHLNQKLAPGIGVLDIGAGAGNTTLALLRMCPELDIVASDLSVPLLALLKQNLSQEFPNHSLSLIQMNAEQMIFAPEQFDLVVGGAILHHLFEPDACLRECYRVLKHGGTAIFFEPFEAGNQMVVMTMRNLVALNQKIILGPKIDPEIRKFFIGWSGETALRIDPDKTKPIFQKLDDKWIFTRTYFERAAYSAGYREVIIKPIHTPRHSFFNQINTLLTIGMNKKIEALPQWAIEYIHSVDETFSDEMHNELLIEGEILLKK